MFNYIQYMVCHCRPLYKTVIYCIHKVYAAKKTGHGSLLCSLVKRSELSGRHAVTNVCAIGISVFIAEITGQDYSRGGRYYRMPAKIFRKRRCLQ